MTRTRRGVPGTAQPRAQRGLSLVELLVALVLGLVLVGGVLSIYLASQQGLRATVKGSRDMGAYALAVCGSGRFLACSGKGVDRAITIWDLGDTPLANPPHCVKVLRGHARGVKFLAFRDHDQHLLSASWDETLVMWDWRRGERVLLRPVRHLSGVTTLTDPDRIAIGTSGTGDLYTLRLRNAA